MRPVRGFSTACGAVVCAVGLPVVAFRPIYRRVRILDNRNLSTVFLGGAFLPQSASENRLHEAHHHERCRRPYDTRQLLVYCACIHTVVTRLRRQSRGSKSHCGNTVATLIVAPAFCPPQKYTYDNKLHYTTLRQQLPRLRVLYRYMNQFPPLQCFAPSGSWSARGFPTRRGTR